MDPQHLSRLQQEQAKAVEETDSQIAQVEKYKGDYRTLQESLRTLPDKLSHDIMVPFGKLAFMSGQVVHTNEIMVLLGDNWFAERTAKQAREIAGRRIEELDKQLKNLKAQRQLLEPRIGFTSDLQSNMKGDGEVQEIVEEYDAEKERLWDEQHRKNVRREAARQRPEEKRREKCGEKAQSSDADLWARLDALEREEADNKEYDSSAEASEAESNEESNAGFMKTKGVRWGDDKHVDKGEGGCVDSDDDDESNASEEEEGEHVRHQTVKRICFTHSDTPPVAGSHTVTSSGEGTNILSPADIYKVFSPASILKKTEGLEPDQTQPATSSRSDVGSFSEDTSRAGDVGSFTEDTSRVGDEATQSAASNFPLPPPGAIKAFSGEVKEANTQLVTMKTDPPRRVSKFKAMRSAQQGPS